MESDAATVQATVVMESWRRPRDVRGARRGFSRATGWSARVGLELEPASEP